MLRSVSAAILALCGAIGAASAFEEPIVPAVTPGEATLTGFRWSAVARVFVGYDTNVQFWNDIPSVPGVPSTDAFFGGASLQLTFEQSLSSAWSFGGGLRADGRGYVDKMPAALVPMFGAESDSNAYAIQPSLFLKYRTMLANGTDLTLNGTYSFRREASKGNEGIGEASHQFAFRADFDVPGPSAFFLAATHTFDNFDHVPADPADNRDAQFTEISAGASYDVGGQHLRSISGRVGYQRNNSMSANWTYSGFIVAAAANFQIHGPVYGVLDASYASRNYAGGFFPTYTPPRLTHQIATIGAKLYWSINPRTTADIGVSHQRVTSDSPAATGSDTKITAGVTVRLH